ncbi:Nnf1-domain-containing protein [Amylocarpus encephaloides]|uniref:Nnf1-domain-containing protein n=1 Tax=Amylocarpus encephaloides TaxID=45428 RepID=A0A9P7YHC8_9HELO|nr:Nnf1-domain-containing protein [Amylocarpus encephaloides]
MAEPSTDAKSPSPPPQPHTQITPGPRAIQFTTLYTRTLSATMNAISYEAFATCFPEIAKGAEGALRAYHGQFLGRLEGLAQEEFETILQERNVVQQLNKLEDIIASAKYRKSQQASHDTVDEGDTAPPHAQPPPELLRAHLAPHLNSQRSHLNARLQTTESQNANLMAEVQRQKAEIEELMGRVRGLVEDVEGAGSMLGEEMVVGGLSEDGRRGEEALSGS